ncbi:MAG: hypothetical protein AB1649_25485 [Chloroflexota bacterium]
MYGKLTFALILVILASLLAVSTAFAVDEPAGSCPPAFKPAMVMDHEEHHHQHAGVHTDRNGDGYICMKEVTPTGKIHVHVDNNLP